MRNGWNQLLFVGIVALTVFSIMVVWPGWPKRYLPDFIDYPEGPYLEIGGRDAMKLGLDLKGGSYVLAEADLSQLPAGTDVDEAMEGRAESSNAGSTQFGVAETEVTREGKQPPRRPGPRHPARRGRRSHRKTALLEFREPTLDESGQNIVCVREDGTEFTVGPQQISEDPDRDGASRSNAPLRMAASGRSSGSPPPAS